jgi:hypothetical protein
MSVEIPSIMYFVVFSSKTAFFKLDDIFPECLFYRDKSPQIEPLACLQEDNACTEGRHCMETLSKRIFVMFEEVCDCDLLILYFKKRNYQGLGAGVFWKDMREPRIITMNPSAWSRIKMHGNVYRFNPGHEFFLSGSSAPPKEVEKSQTPPLD